MGFEETEVDKVTNFDKWKAMTIQEAADTLARMPFCMDRVCKGDKFCSDCAKEWLKKESEE